jgi:DNA-binding NtrC family response regulator
MSADPIAAILVGESPAMKRLRAQIARVAPSELPVLIQGPTGAGKELVAYALHRASRRPGEFVAFNVCAIPDSMFEDALFGHVKGAFTGAVSDSAGYLLEAHRGTALLDEVSGLTLAGQAKLLRAIETKRFRPVGGRTDRTSDFRVISATNEDLTMLASQGRFRSDLIHRLAGAVLQVPPLKERREDIPTLAQHFLQQRVDQNRSHATLTMGALRALQDYDWPGNVRELKYAIDRALALSATSTIGRDDIRAIMGDDRQQPVRAVDADADLARERLIALLEEAEWNAERAARTVGCHKATLYRRMKRLAIVRPNRLRNGIQAAGAPTSRGQPATG